MIHLDTSFLVDLLREARKGEGGPAHRFLEGRGEEEVRISFVVACELHAGAAASTNPEGEGERVAMLLTGIPQTLPDHHFPVIYGGLFAELRRRGRPVSALDLLIGTSALADGAPLVTRNIRDFEPIPGLALLTY